MSRRTVAAITGVLLGALGLAMGFDAAVRLSGGARPSADAMRHLIEAYEGRARG